MNLKNKININQLSLSSDTKIARCEAKKSPSNEHEGKEAKVWGGDNDMHPSGVSRVKEALLVKADQAMLRCLGRD